MGVSYRVSELAACLGAEWKGDLDAEITTIATIQNAKVGSLTFLANPLYREYLSTTTASVVVVRSEDASLCNGAAIIVDDPYVAYAQLASLYAPAQVSKPGIHPTAVVDQSAELHNSVSIGPHVVIGPRTKLAAYVIVGAGTVLGSDVVVNEGTEFKPKVVIYDGVQIGARGLFHSGCVVGSDGFGFANQKGRWIKVPQLGTVVIGSDVEIGANTTIDCGAVENTVIEDGVKIDNQVQIAHNVKIGAHTVIAGCAGIAGSATIGRYCAIGGSACINGHISIVDGTQITGMAMVTHSIKEPGVYSSGTGFLNNAEWRKNAVRFRQLDKIARTVHRLEKSIGCSNSDEDTI